MSGNLCRCTGYVGIIRAVQTVLADRRARGISPMPDAGRTALGPVGSGHAATAPSGAASVSARVSGPAAEPTAASAPLSDFTPQATFEQSFTVAYPRDVVWAFFADTQALAECLPGASLTGAPSDRQVSGKMRVKVGPISGDFHGTAEIVRDASTWTGTVTGSGRDTRSNSATRGRITYRLAPGEASQATRVDVTVAYALTGALAQFSRSGLVQDVANRLTQVFVQNLEARLAGKIEPGKASAELNAGSLVYAAILGRFKLWLGRLLGR